MISFSLFLLFYVGIKLKFSFLNLYFVKTCKLLVLAFLLMLVCFYTFGFGMVFGVDGRVLVVVSSDDCFDLVLSGFLCAVASFATKGGGVGLFVPWSEVYLIVVPFGVFDEAYVGRILELKPFMAFIVGNYSSVPRGYGDALRAVGVDVRRVGGGNCQERSILLYEFYVEALCMRAPFGEFEFPPRAVPVIVPAGRPCIPWGSFPILFVNITDELLSFMRNYGALVHCSLRDQFSGFNVAFTDVDLIEVFRGVRGFRIFSSIEVLNELRRAYIPEVLPKFVVHDFTNLSKVHSISRFRSCAGHEFPDSFERGSSLKHYYEPYDEYKGTLNRVEVFSPVNGTIMAIVPEGKVLPTGEPRGMRIHILVDDYPGFMIELFHVNVFENVTVGMKVRAGDMLGYFDMRDANDFDIAVSYISPVGIKYYSYFDVMSDEVFIEYRRRGIVSRDQMKFPYEERIKCPCNFTYFHPEDWVNLSPIEQPVALVTLNSLVPRILRQYEEVELKLVLTNLGEVTARNVEVEVISAEDIEIDSETIHVGALDGGRSLKFKLKIKPLTAGSKLITFKLSYLDEEGRWQVENYYAWIKVLEVRGELEAIPPKLKLKVGREHRLTITIKNAGQIDAPFTLVVEGVNVKVSQPSFTVNTSAGGEVNITLTVAPLSEGSGELKLKLLFQNIVQSTAKILIEAWKVRGELHVLEVPGELMVGEEASIKISIVNSGGISATYTMKVSSDDFEVNPQKLTVTIPAQSSKDVTLKVKALREGRGTVKFELYEDNNLLDTKEVNIEIKSKKIDFTILLIPIIAIVAAIAFILVIKKR